MDKEKAIQELMATTAMSYSDLNYLVNRIINYKDYEERIIDESRKVIEYKMSHNVSIEDAFTKWKTRINIDDMAINAVKAARYPGFTVKEFSAASKIAFEGFKMGEITLIELPKE